MGNLIVAIIVAGILLGGPFTLFAAIKLLNSAFGSIKVRFVKLTAAQAGDPTLGLMVGWDPESFENQLFRVKVDFQELVRGGRSASFSFTFEGKAAKKRSFVIPMKLAPEDLEMLTDRAPGLPANALDKSSVFIEVENVRGETVRFRIPKSRILETVAGTPTAIDTATVDLLPAREPDVWSLQTRVFPWLAMAAVEEAPKEKKAAGAKKAGGAPTLVDFLVTKVWIEPGCIVCDACENEAPLVFQVLADTCIVRENAPLDDGASIAAAAEGCPVDVIKYDKKPKPAVAG